MSCPDRFRAPRDFWRFSSCRRPIPPTSRREEPRAACAEQTFAAEAAAGRNAVVVIEGAPGSGKTKTLVPIVEAWQAAGHRVIGTAIFWRVARALQQDLNIEARATASWVERLKRGERFLDERSVLIVDEAGSISRPVDIHDIKLRRGPAFHLLGRR
jgi:ATP-dependent exoDNAse (exonuclease V) alpha subunit